ncbi:YdcF family protein [Patescibacteria group bacterium]|nr:YdcF family protein [Patescibacteria group bacterium]
MVLNTVIFFYYERHMFSSSDKITGTADAVIILGASVKGNQLSQTVQDRVETAIQLYQTKKVPKILISGDGDPTKFYNEVKAINRYVINRGIPPADVFLDFN